MSSWRSRSGRPLASPEWLEIHHRAKFLERLQFAHSVVQRTSPSRIVDLGCATGLWLEIFDSILPSDCEFVGIDTDADSLAVAERRAQTWNRKTRFEQADFETHPDAVPAADLTLAFNVFPYLNDARAVLADLAGPDRDGLVVVRQYDGGTMRLGPMGSRDRALIEESLQVAVGTSAQFRHYDMDRVFDLLADWPATETSFELYEAKSPYSEHALAYIKGMIDWMRDLVSDEARTLLDKWSVEQLQKPQRSSYFVEVDLVSFVS